MSTDQSHPADPRTVARIYLQVKRRVIDAGYAWEGDWQASVGNHPVSESQFLREAAWVILSSGMSEQVVHRVFSRVTHAFLNWRSASAILDERVHCRREALTAFRHPGKIDAIVAIAQWLVEQPLAHRLARLQAEGPLYLQKLPYMGPATSFHLAKNLGLPVVKADRHLRRIAHLFGYGTPSALCGAISLETGEAIAVVDVVFWRFSTLERGYRQVLSGLRDGIDMCEPA